MIISSKYDQGDHDYDHYCFARVKVVTSRIYLWGLNVALNSLDSIVLVLACSSGTLIIRTGIGHWDPCYSLAPLLYLPRMLKSILIQTPWSNHA